MAGKKSKNPKHTSNVQQQAVVNTAPKKELSDVFFDIFSGSLTKFDDLDATTRIQRYGDQNYLDQFWEFFKVEHPQLLDQIDRDDLPVYFDTIKNKGFSLPSLAQEKTAKILHREFAESDTEDHVIQQSLSDLKIFCADTNNMLPPNAFDDFAAFAGFDKTTLDLDPTGKITTIDHLPIIWQKFLDKNHIALGKASAAEAERIVAPNYYPIERFMITAAITKIKKQLPGPLKNLFAAAFPLPVDVFSSCQDLLHFRTDWVFFLSQHADQIDESLTKKLDSIIVTNGDIQSALLDGGRSLDGGKGFSQWEGYFRRMFNKLVTRQLFEDVKKSQDTVDFYVDALGSTFTKFPPYLNAVFEQYPFEYTKVSVADPTLSADIQSLAQQIDRVQQTYIATTNDDEKLRLKQQIDDLVSQQETRKWQAYIAFLRTQNPALSDVFAVLVAGKFDFSLLSAAQQQVLVDTLIAQQLEDIIKNKVPELLDVSEAELSQFFHDLFDLNTLVVEIPSQEFGPIPLTFLKKSFLASVRTQLPSITDIQSEDIKNIPLDFLAQLEPANAGYFENNVIFDSLYDTFVDKTNTAFRINEAYKVRLTKDGHTVEGYLSAYPPSGEQSSEDADGKEWYLYSSPVTAPDQARTLVSRDGTASGLPVKITDDEQKNCSMEVLDKQIHLNGDALGALLFSYVLGKQSAATSMPSKKYRQLGQKIGKLDLYREQADQIEEQPRETDERLTQTPSLSAQDSVQETSEKNPFLDAWQELAGYDFPDDQYKENRGFVEGAKLFVSLGDSDVPPLRNGKARMYLEITNINKQANTFTVTMHGGEFSLGGHEGVSKTLPITPNSFSFIAETFGDKLYKMPPSNVFSFDQHLQMLEQSGMVSGLDKTFGGVNLDRSKFTHALGNYSGKEITHFGVYEPLAINEPVDQEGGKIILYSIKPNTNGTITVSGDSSQRNYVRKYPPRTMDYHSFLLFIREKQLQPKCKEQIVDIYATKKANDEEVKTTIRPYSILNITSFFKNSINKFKDAIKKNDDERAEDLTDLLINKGHLRSDLSGFLSPFERMSGAFERMGMDAISERDNRVRKKVEKRAKFYEDYDYTDFYNRYIGPMLRGEITIVPHYKIAAMLLVNIKKAKGPYGKHASLSNEGKWIGLLLGKDHQQRYLAMREKRIRDLEENASNYSGPELDQIKNELAELEMRYLVHVMDGRHMGVQDGDKTKYYFQNKYSKKFCDELEGAYTGFYKQDGVNEGFTKNEGANFEFARVEYFRQLADRPQQALPFLKVMATKAGNETQRQVFEAAVLAGMLSGVFLTMTFSQTQSFIQKICRTRGFVPGIFAKDVRQQTKVQKLLDLFSGGKFTASTGYDPANFSYRTNIGAGKFISEKFLPRIQSDIGFAGGGSKSVMSSLSKFLSLTGGNVDNKTLLDLYVADSTSMADKLLIKEFIGKTNEKDEELDKNVSDNTSSLTGSILTKGQSVVHKMIKIDRSGFAGQNGDEVQNMKAFCNNMKDAIPSGKEKSQETVKFFVQKFFNRFEERGFSGNQKTKFIQRLKWCKEHAGSPDVDTILYYGIVGEIVSALSSHGTLVPDELLGALGARKNFFQNNLDIILTPDVVSSSFGANYTADLASQTPRLEPWDKASLLLDRETNYLYTQTLDKTQKQEALTKKRELSNSKKYLNQELYVLAQDLEKKCSGFSNRFVRDVGQIKKSLVSEIKKPVPTQRGSGIHIKNAELLNNLNPRRDLSSLNEDDEYASPMFESEYYDY